MVQDDLLVDSMPIEEIPFAPSQILIVDDDQEQADALAIAFRRQGYDVRTAHSVRQADRMIRTEPPQLVIMDIHLPDGDGVSECRRLSDEESTSEIPVILLSGTDRLDIVRSARAAGCHFFLRKPYDPNALLLLAENALAQRPEW